MAYSSAFVELTLTALETKNLNRKEITMMKFQNQMLGEKNGYKGTYDRNGLYVYHNENYNVQPLIVLRNIVGTKGLDKGKLISKFAFCIMKGKFLRLAKDGTLNHGATITFDGFVCPMQSLPNVSKIIWPKHIKQLDHFDHNEPFPLDNKTIVGKVISSNLAKYSNIPRKDEYIHDYQQWKKVTMIK